MTMLLRNFFYAVGLVALFFMYGVDPSTVTFGDLARLVQSRGAQSLVVVVMIALIIFDFPYNSYARVTLPRRGNGTEGKTSDHANAEKTA